MTKKNIRTLAVALAAAVAVGAAMWFADGFAARWRAARPPAGFQGGGGGGGGRGGAPASPRVDPPSFAFTPLFDEKATNTQVLAHYVRQVPMKESPTLDDWQKLLNELPKDVPGGGTPLTLPIGRGHFVMAMCADLAGNLWIGTEGEGIFCYNPAKPASEQWAQFTTKDGLGDDYGYAMACDLQGRVWVGHLNHGVSVFNGEKWQTYEVVGGLSRPDTLNGPLGERLFEIAVAPQFVASASPPMFHNALTEKDSPMAGSVWMASSAGLAIYFPSTDTWSYVTRAEGMASDQANAIAFGADGTVYVGTQCDGIAIAGPGDKYATWKQVTAANPVPHAVDGKIVDFPVPTVGKGSGLPTDLINDLLVARDGTVYAATTLGLAWSTDKGNSWQYVRGADWIDKVKNRMGGSPQGWQPPTDAEKGGGILAEDYTTALAEDGDGNLLVGHRATGGEILTSKVGKRLDVITGQYLTSLGFTATHQFRGTYGQGVLEHHDERKAGDAVAKMVNDSQATTFPGKVDLQSTQRMAEEVNRLNHMRNDIQPSVFSMEDDWLTGGNWIDRYGNFYAVMCAQGGISDFTGGYRAAYAAVRAGVGQQGNDNLRYWVFPTQLNSPRDLQCLEFGGRKTSEWDDHGEVFTRNMEGPDIYCTLKLPPGEYVISLYFMSNSGHDVGQRMRDYVIELKNIPMTGAEFRSLGSNDRSIEARFRNEPIGARSRVSSFWGGVYKRFYARIVAPEMPTIHVARNFSYNTVLLGVFVDPAGALCGPQGPERQPPRPRTAFEELNGNGVPHSLDAAIIQQLVHAHDSRPGRYLQSGPIVINCLRSLLAVAPNGRLAPRVNEPTQSDSFRQNFAVILAGAHVFSLSERAYFGDVRSRRQTMYWEWMSRIQDPRAKPHFSSADEQEFIRTHEEKRNW